MYFSLKIFYNGSQLSPDESRREGSNYSRNESEYPKKPQNTIHTLFNPRNLTLSKNVVNYV